MNLRKLSYTINHDLGKHKKMGGMREGSGKGKSGYYKGFFLNSTYELAYLIYCLDHNIAIERNTKGYPYFDPDRNGWFTYYPDFMCSDRLIEIKGYRSRLNEYKLSGVTEPISILYKEDLKDIFSYVASKTGINIDDLYLLYENIPKIDKLCEECNTSFNMTKKKTRFCCQRCSAVFMGKSRKIGTP